MEEAAYLTLLSQVKKFMRTSRLSVWSGFVTVASCAYASSRQVSGYDSDMRTRSLHALSA
jgi:hypothetical protein